MSHQFLDGEYRLHLTPAHDVALGNYGPRAIERLRAFGLADRRESAVAIVLAGAVPAAGMLLVGWSPSTAVIALLLNVLVGLYQDLWTILRARGRLAVMEQLCNQDAFVWAVARARSRRRRTMQAPLDIDSSDRLDELHDPRDVFVMAGLATVAVVLPAWIVWRDPTLHAEPVFVALGTLPNLALFGLAALLQATAHNAHWRDAASTRLDSASRNVKLAFGTGLAALLLFVVPLREPLPEALATAGCVAVAAIGIGVLVATGHLENLAAWLERWLEVRRGANAATVPRKRG